MGRDPELGAEIVRAIKKELSIPVLVKLTAEGTDIVEVAKKIVSASADGITAVNRFQALDIDINTGRPLLHGTFAGIGGSWMLSITLRWIAKLAMELKHIPISAINGVWIWEDVVKMYYGCCIDSSNLYGHIIWDKRIFHSERVYKWTCIIYGV